MTSALLALALAVSDPIGFPPPAEVVRAAAPAASPSPTPAPTPAPEALRATTPLSLPSAGPGLDGLILPVAVLLALAIAALILSRRRQKAPRLVQVLERTALGPKRALVVARVGDEVLVIGSSEAGLQLLSARPAAVEARGEAPARLVAVPDPDPRDLPSAPAQGPVLGLLSRLRPGRRASAAPPAIPAGLDAFDALLAESAEDQELRRKLAMGQAGSVR
jgi:hypothetical protein